MLLPVGALALLLAACTAEAPDPAPAASPASPASLAPAASPAPAGSPGPCGSPVSSGPLPSWARAGFTGDSSMPHVVGARGEILAAVFGDPLRANRTDGAANKILWVARSEHGPGELTIAATLDGTTTEQVRTVPGGPGPSIVDLPRAGCWRLVLTWPGHTDTMELVYR